MKTEFTCGNYKALWIPKESALIESTPPARKEEERPVKRELEWPARREQERRVAVTVYQCLATISEVEEATETGIGLRRVQTMHELGDVSPATLEQRWGAYRELVQQTASPITVQVRQPIPLTVEEMMERFSQGSQG